VEAGVVTVVWILLVFIAFALGRFERSDRRIERQVPITINPSLKQLRTWRSDRL
jgi:hypothetical protein